MTAARLPDGPERRAACEMHAAPGLELRADTAGRRLTGYAAVWNAPATIGGFTETIQPGAFRASLASGRDVLALVDHDPSKLLGRTGSGTLTLAEDSRGLAFDIALPDTALARDLLALVERRDAGGMSFGFKATDESWPTSTRRELRAVELYEISVVLAFPAYSQTTISARARVMAKAEASARLRRLILRTA